MGIQFRSDLQIKRLKERLRREREFRDNGGDGDLDLEALIEALQSGEEINDAAKSGSCRHRRADRITECSETLLSEFP